MIAGCGTSRLGLALHERYSYGHITSVDNDPAIIAQMAARNADKPSMKWIEADLTKPFAPASSFDMCVDKSTLDAMMGSNEIFYMVRHPETERAKTALLLLPKEEGAALLAAQLNRSRARRFGERSAARGWRRRGRRQGRGCPRGCPDGGR